MPVTLSIKNTPDDVADALRQQAARNHRSLQGELLVIVEQAAAKATLGRDQGDVAREIIAAWEKLGVSNPSESTAMIREDRNR